MILVYWVETKYQVSSNFIEFENTDSLHLDILLILNASPSLIMAEEITTELPNLGKQVFVISPLG